MAADPVVAAGAVVRRGEGSDCELALVHRPRYDDWSFPKGKREPGEHVTATAVREVAEETGLNVALRRPLSSREYLVDDRPKIVHYWVAELTGQPPKFEVNREVDALEWVSPAAAEHRLTQPRDAELVGMAMAQPAGTPFAVVRHAKARKRAGWTHPDAQRPLTDVGRRDAKALAPVLAAFGVQRLHTSPALRCCRTLQPYAKRDQRPLVEEAALDEALFGPDPAQTLKRAKVLMLHAGVDLAPTAVCTHRPVIPALVGHLLEGSGFAGPTEALPTASLLVLHVTGSAVLATEFHTLR